MMQSVSVEIRGNVGLVERKVDLSRRIVGQGGGAGHMEIREWVSRLSEFEAR